MPNENEQNSSVVQPPFTTSDGGILQGHARQRQLERIKQRMAANTYAVRYADGQIGHRLRGDICDGPVDYFTSKDRP